MIFTSAIVVDHADDVTHFADEEIRHAGSRGCDDGGMDTPEHYAELLALGAQESGTLEVKRVHLPKLEQGLTHRTGKGKPLDWVRYWRTLHNHIEVGAYAVIQRSNGSRIVWTTTSGKAQENTLKRWTGRPVKTFKAADVDELEAQLLEDITEVFADAEVDRRARSVMARNKRVEDVDGWVDGLRERRAQAKRFWEVAAGRDQLPPEDAHAYLLWWSDQVGRELQLETGGLPVSKDVLEVVEQAGLVGFLAAKAPAVGLQYWEFGVTDDAVTWIFKLDDADEVHEALGIAAAAAREVPVEVGSSLQYRGAIEVKGRSDFVELVAERLVKEKIEFEVW